MNEDRQVIGQDRVDTRVEARLNVSASAEFVQRDVIPVITGGEIAIARKHAAEMAVNAREQRTARLKWILTVVGGDSFPIGALTRLPPVPM